MGSISFLESLEVISRSLQAQKSYTIEKYNDVESTAFIAYNASDATNAIAVTTEGQKPEASSQSLHIICQSKLKIEKNQLENPGVLKETNGNIAKR